MMIQIGDWTGVISDIGSELQRIIVLNYNRNNDDTNR